MTVGPPGPKDGVPIKNARWALLKNPENLRASEKAKLGERQRSKTTRPPTIVWVARSTSSHPAKGACSGSGRGTLGGVQRSRS